MNAFAPAAAASRQLLSGNEAVARAVWEAGCRVASAYPGTPSTEILESLARYPDLFAQWAVNEKVSLEVAIGASMAGSRAFCAMKHVGLNVASDALMSQTLAGASGGLVIAVADDVGLSSSQNEQDSRYWGRFAHLPILEPADSQEAYAMTKEAFALSERFNCPVILRMTTRVCHVKAMVTVGERETVTPKGFERDPSRWVLVPAVARNRLPVQFARDEALRAFSEETGLNRLEDGGDRAIGFIASGPAALHVRESFPDAPIFKLGFSHPLPIDRLRAFAATVDKLVVVEETEPLVETELKAQGLALAGKDILPRAGELSPNVLKPAIAALKGETVPENPRPKLEVFPRPPTMCVACPHMAVYYTLSRLRRNVLISGDIGCYTLGAGHPWNALDTTICMGASMGIALGLDKGRAEADKDKAIVAVIGDSTFLHMGLQGLLTLTYTQGNVTILLLDNRAVGMTGGQDHPGTGRDILGEEAPRVDMAKLVEALGVKPERIHTVNPYELPTLYRALREETAIAEPSVIITNQPCVLITDYQRQPAYTVDEEACTGCANCLRVGCPAIHVTRRETEIKGAKTIERAFVRIDTNACTGCNFCPQTCGPKAILPADGVQSLSGGHA